MTTLSMHLCPIHLSICSLLTNRSAILRELLETFYSKGGRSICPDGLCGAQYGGQQQGMLLILGRSFLNTTNARIFVGSGQSRLHVERKRKGLHLIHVNPFLLFISRSRQFVEGGGQKQGRYNHPKR